MGVARLFRFETPYAEDELRDIDFEQSADVMYLAHRSHPPAKLARYDHADWRFSEVAFGATILPPTGVAASPHIEDEEAEGYTPVALSYVVTAIQTDNGQESLQSLTAACLPNDLSLDGNYNTITWAAVAGTELYQVYKEQNGLFGYIGGTVDLTFKDDNIQPDLGNAPPQDRQPFDATNDYPGRVAFYQQRLVWARTNSKPNGVWTSQSANFENLNVARPAKADDAITFALVARQINAITALVPLKSLIVFTTDAIFAINGGQQGFITPSALSDTPQSYRGCSGVRPAIVDDVVFFNTSKGASIRTLGYQFDVDGYKGNDITIFAPHLFKGFTIIDMAWAEAPTSTLWCVRSDGKLLALTWQAEQDVWGWSLCETDGFVESCTVITESGEDRLYILVRRMVGEVERRFIERAATYLWTDFRFANFLDSSRGYDGDPVQVVAGLDHLEGRTVSALADGNVITGLVVEDGAVDLGAAFSTIIVGIPYRAWVKTLPPLGSGQIGSLLDVTKQIGEVTFQVERTRGLKYGVDETDTDNIFEMKNRMGEAYGDPIEPFTGRFQETMPGTWSLDPGVVAIQDYPLPMALLGVFAKVNTGG